MNNPVTAPLGLLTLATALVACKSSPEGKYVLDQAATQGAYQATVDQLPAEQQPMAKLSLAMIPTMNLSMELKSGGALEVASSILLDKSAPPIVKTQTGTWRLDGSKLITTVDGRDATCDVAGGKLTCAPDRPEGITLIFTKP